MWHREALRLCRLGHAIPTRRIPCRCRRKAEERGITMGGTGGDLVSGVFHNCPLQPCQMPARRSGHPLSTMHRRRCASGLVSAAPSSCHRSGWSVVIGCQRSVSVYDGTRTITSACIDRGADLLPGDVASPSRTDTVATAARLGGRAHVGWEEQWFSWAQDEAWRVR